MHEKFSLASAAALIADPARAAMLTAMLDARPRSAGELALLANVSAQSASMHLSQLLTGGFLRVTRQGRHRYYEISSHRVAHAVEALGTIATSGSFRPQMKDRALWYARTCYDHLAGQLGVELTAAMERNHVLVPHGERDYEITRSGERFLALWRIEANSVRNTRRVFARRCLDWTERRYHLAGALGAAICAKFLELSWIARERKTRIVHLTPTGRSELARILPLANR
jgi:DNA-binding transcriptional ArsR family regulator